MVDTLGGMEIACVLVKIRLGWFGVAGMYDVEGNLVGVNFGIISISTKDTFD